MTFDELCNQDENLLALYQECQITAGTRPRMAGGKPRGHAPENFCFGQFWYAVPGKRGDFGMKAKLQGLAKRNPLIAANWDLCYHTLVDALPACTHEGGCLGDYENEGPIDPETAAQIVAAGGEVDLLERKFATGFKSLLQRLREKATAAAGAK